MGPLFWWCCGPSPFLLGFPPLGAPRAVLGLCGALLLAEHPEGRGPLCHPGFERQRSEQRSRFLSKTPSKRRGNATGADLKENMLTM